MRIAAITGGGQGIGRAIALAFARKGYAVTIADAVEDGGREVVALIEAEGGRALFEPTDVARKADVTRWIARTVAELGCPGVLINNAGISVRKPFLELAVEDFERVHAVNVRGTFCCTQGIAREMVKADVAGSIINIASTRAFMSEAGTEAYSASKGAIVALTHAMAISLGAHHIRVNCICPGWIETRDWQHTSRTRAVTHREVDRTQHPVGRVGVPDDIARACLFLAEDAPFMTGQSLVVDGGMTVKMIYAE